MNISIGTLIGPYEILAPLGAGGMGEVYRAHDKRLGRSIALKVLSTDLAASGEHLRRFEQEARAASALNHPNIITIYDIGRVDTMAYIAMELIEGRDVRSLMAGERLAAKQSLRIAVKVADGLAAAHERGIVHRDLKPENLMVSRDGFVKILDFGLAKLVRPFTENDATLPHTTPGAVFGTVGYMSPEQAAGRAVDYRSDQFALGVILYEMLTGHLPFQAATAAETLVAIIRTDPPPMAHYNEAVPAELTRVVARLLSKDPEDRYASTRDLARDLREIRDRITNSTGPRHDSTPRRSPLRRRGAMIAAALAVIAFGAGVVTIIRNAPTPLEAPAGIKAQSIAVLPFRDLSGSPEGQMLTDGITATVSSRLARTPIRVAAQFVGSAVDVTDDPKELARRSGADLLLQGNVQRFGEQLRVSFSLIDPARATQLAADTVTGPAADLFALQDLIGDRVVSLLKLQDRDAAAKGKVAIANPADQRLYLEAYGLLWRLKDDSSVDLAIGRLESLLSNARDSAPVNALLGRAYLTRYRRLRKPADLEQAALFAGRAVELDPTLADAHAVLGDVHIHTGNAAGAETEFRRALQLEPNLPLAVVGLADTLAKLGRGNDAEAEYARAVRIAPDWPSVYSKRGGFYYARGDFKRAVEDWERMAELIPDSPRGYANLGAAYMALGQYEKALQSHQRSLSISPSAAAYVNRGTCEYLLGRYSDAVRSFEKATELTPDNPVCWMGLGDARRWAGTPPAATEEAYAHAIRTAAIARAANKEDPLPRVIAAVSHAKSGRAAEARREIDAALRMDPTNATTLYQAAVIAAIRKDAESATGWLNRAIANGYSKHDAARDPEFRDLREDPAFQKVIATARKAS
ncbi:MAG: protein kinase [Thermoanaerobaculia bacterium]